MTINLQNVLKLEGFKEAKVVAGEKGLTNIVKKATLMEVPDIFLFVEENSLILTTLYPIYNNVEAINNIIPKSIESNVAGMCIKTGRYIESIPHTMIQQANELNFPLIEIQGNANLSNMASDILSFSLDQHIKSLQFQKDVHNHLMNMFLKGESIQSLIESFSNLISCPTILLDNNLLISAVSSNIDKENLQIYNLVIQDGKTSFSIKKGNKIYSKKDYISYAIEAEANKFGYLILLDGNKTDQGLMMAIEEASLLLASAFYKNHAVMEKEKNFQDSFIRDILKGVHYSQMEITTKAKIYGWNMEFPEVIFVLKSFNENEFYKKREYEEIVHSRIIESILNKNLNISSRKIKITYIDELLVVFVNVAFVKDIKKLMKRIGNLIVEKLHNKYSIGIGISNPIVDVYSFPNAYIEAKDSLFIGHKLHQKSFVSYYDDNQLFNVLKEVKNLEILDKFVKDKIGKILAYDNEIGMDLLRTLLVLIEVEFNYKEAAKKLYIHYNTLRYRVKRLKELGINTNNGLELAEIALAYYASIWLEVKKEPRDFKINK